MSESALALSLISAGAALVGALGSQLISSLSAHRLKRMEISAEMRASAYAELMSAIGEFSMNPKREDAYLAYLGAYEKAKVFASDRVFECLNGPNGLNYTAQKLRQADGAMAEGTLQTTDWYEVVERLSDAMRVDLRHVRDQRA